MIDGLAADPTPYEEIRGSSVAQTQA
jgi:hypothetical protein